MADQQTLLFTAAVAGFALILFGLELLFPLRTPKKSLKHRLVVNAAMSVLTYGTVTLLVQPASMMAINWTELESFGLLHWVGGPTWLQFIIGFLLLDLTFYYWHRINHELPWLWRLHNVHHTDPDLDVSTGFRFHFAEVGLSTVFRVAQVLLIGVSLSTFVIFQLLFQLATFFHHSNLRLPAPIDKALNLIIVTPRMHGIHHSKYHQETDSNYSVIFSFWDRLNRTFRQDIPQHKIDIGVPGYSNDSDNRLKELIVMVFQKQRDYWQGNESRS